MATFPLNFDLDIAHRAAGELQPATREWTELSLTEQLVRLGPFMRAQAARDAKRGVANEQQG